MEKFKNDFEFGSILSEPEIALYFVQKKQDTVRYCRESGNWYHFDKIRWEEDPKTLQIRKILGLTTKEYFDKNLLRCANEEQQVMLQKFIIKSLRSSALKRILADAEIISEIQISKDEFDRHLTLLVTPSGTVDLATGLLRESKSEDFMTKVSATQYKSDLSPEKACPRFIKFMEDVTGGDEELKNHILKILSYCLTGLSTEQKIYLLFGPGANGKTVLLEAIRAIFGTELVIHSDSKTLVKNNRVIREDVARFEGARLATCSEIGKCDTLDEPLIKGLSGKDRQVSRKLHENSTEFENHAKIIIATNYLPDLEGTDQGIARRLEVIPFKQSFSGNPDPMLREKLIQEREGILALLVQYATDVVKNGVGSPPQAIKEATDHYIKFGNSVKCFLHDCCVTDAPGKKSTLRTVFDSYKEYCKQNRVNAVSTRDFTRLLKMMGFEQQKSGPTRYWRGLDVIGNAACSSDEEFVPEASIGDINSSDFTISIEPPESKETKTIDEAGNLKLPSNENIETAESLEQ